jgi:hypothetical protein
MLTLPTRRSRRTLRTILVALCAMLFAQWALAAHACPVIQRAGDLIAQVQLAAEIAEEVAAADCHGQGVSVELPDPGSTTCVKHCADDGSTSGSALPTVAAPPPALVLRAELPAVPLPSHDAPRLARDASAPPLTILYCFSLT